ncbi:MAG TPA: hypothetical protein VJB88_03790, partial [Vicinamibacteria bacterium]|nr:hypothetical protein [Vicinamibacteria bacterium]
RAHQSAAPLKPHVAGAGQLAIDEFPRSPERGPIEAHSPRAFRVGFHWHGTRPLQNLSPPILT